MLAELMQNPILLVHVSAAVRFQIPFGYHSSEPVLTSFFVIKVCCRIHSRSPVTRLADFGATAFVASPAALDTLVVEQTEKWGKVIRAANIKAE